MHNLVPNSFSFRSESSRSDNIDYDAHEEEVYHRRIVHFISNEDGHDGERVDGINRQAKSEEIGFGGNHDAGSVSFEWDNRHFTKSLDP